MHLIIIYFTDFIVHSIENRTEYCVDRERKNDYSELEIYCNYCIEIECIVVIENYLIRKWMKNLTQLISVESNRKYQKKTNLRECPIYSIEMEFHCIIHVSFLFFLFSLSIYCVSSSLRAVDRISTLYKMYRSVQVAAVEYLKEITSHFTKRIAWEVWNTDSLLSAMQTFNEKRKGNKVALKSCRTLSKKRTNSTRERKSNIKEMIPAIGVEWTMYELCSSMVHLNVNAKGKTTARTSTPLCMFFCLNLSTTGFWPTTQLAFVMLH